MCTMRLTLHLADLLSTYYTNKFATNPQQIKPMELYEPSFTASLASIGIDASNSGPPSMALMTTLNCMPWQIFYCTTLCKHGICCRAGYTLGLWQSLECSPASIAIFSSLPRAPTAVLCLRARRTVQRVASAHGYFSLL